MYKITNLTKSSFYKMMEEVIDMNKETYKNVTDNEQEEEEYKIANVAFKKGQEIGIKKIINWIEKNKMESCQEDNDRILYGNDWEQYIGVDGNGKNRTK